MAATLTRASVSVWLPSAAHAALAGIAAREGVSLAVLARRAAAYAVGADGGRVAMPAPTGETVEELRAAGYGLNRLLPAFSEAATAAQRAAITARIGAALDRIAAAAARVCLSPSSARLARPVADGDGGGGGRGRGEGWRLVRVTTDPQTVRLWEGATKAAGFRSVANWIRDALAGLYGVAVARPPTPVTIDARQVAGRVAGLIAQTQIAVADWPISVPGLDRRVEAAGDALWAALESLVGYGGDPKARR